MEPLQPLCQRSAGIDVHQMLNTVTVLVEEDDGTVSKHQRSFGSFQRDKRELVQWLLERRVELVVMESTGIFWKSLYAHLERGGITTWVVNAQHVKHVPGRKTDMADSEWLAVLARFGLVRGSFIPPQDLRELRLLSRYRRKLAQMLAAEKNRLHKVLDDGGIKLGGVVSDIDGVSAQRMIAGLLAGKDPSDLATMGLGALKHKQELLEQSLEGELSARHLFVLQHLSEHIRFVEQQMSELDTALFDAMAPYAWAWRLLQTLPGVDAVAAAMLLVEIGDDMSRFGHPRRLASWAGVCPGNHESAGKRHSGKTRKGNQTVRYLLCECANAARKTKSTFAAKFQGLLIRRGYKKAILAVAHQMLRTLFFMLSRRQPYRDPGIDYLAVSVKKNAPRWLRNLKKFGFLPSTPAASA